MSEQRTADAGGLLHHGLVNSNRLQGLPWWAVVLAFGVNAAIIALIWLPRGANAALPVILDVAVANFLNWYLLWLLPRRRKSFGPDKPSALALGVVHTLIAAVLGIVNAPPVVVLVLLVLVTALTVYATWIEPFRLGVTEQGFFWEECVEDHCLRLLHIGDIHVERITEREKQLNALIAEIQPDVIVFSGDFVNLSYTIDKQAETDIRNVIRAWRAPLGVFCVPGTPQVEPLPRVKKFVSRLKNLTLLLNTWVTVPTTAGDLHILGLITTHDLPTDRAALAKAMQTAPPDGIKLLLTHSPDIAPEAAAAGFDLYLCGHTHGGQLRLPLIGALLTASQLGKRFEMGRYAVGKMMLYVTRGVGMEGLGAPRARFLCPPEIVLWHFGSGR